MVINEEYLLPTQNYVNTNNIKTQIIFGNTFNHDMRHIIGWLNRYNGKYKKTAAFTIGFDGTIYKHFDPSYQSEYFKLTELNKKSIVILLENEGWLVKNEEENKFISWIGDIYKQSDEVYEKKWRGRLYWSPYSDKQLESALELVNMLCEEFSIPKVAIGHNTWVDGLEDFSGVLFKSNISKYETDLTPAFDFNYFKEKLENTQQ